MALTLATLAVYLPVRDCDFFSFDDPDYVTENTNIHDGITIEGLKWAFTTRSESNWHPLTWMSHMLDCHLFELDPASHHLTNLLFHIANTLLLFAVFKRMTGAIWQSAFVAALFALHPAHVESVAWISERKDVLSTFFWLLTMAAYIGYVKHRQITWYLFTLLMFALGLMAKPMLVSLPLVLLMLDYWPLNRIKNRRTLYKLVIEKLPFFALSVGSCIVTFFVQMKGGALSGLGRVALGLRVNNIVFSYARYIVKMIWPDDLAFFYPLPGYDLPMYKVVLSAIFLLALSIFVIRLAKKRRYLLTGWMWYIVTLIPVIGIVQVGQQAMADRYTYVPFTGLFIIISWGFAQLIEKWKWRKIALSTLSLIVIVLLAVSSRIQLSYWKNTITLCEHAIEVTEKNFIAHSLLSCALRDDGQMTEAVYHNKLAMQINPRHPNPFFNMGNILASQGKFDEAVYFFRKTLEIRPSFPGGYKHLGKALLKQGNFTEAAYYYQKALTQSPLDHEVNNGIGITYGRLAMFDEAISYFAKAIEIKPDFAEAYVNLGRALAQQKKFDEAVSHLTEAARLEPNSANIHNKLAMTLSRSGKAGEAVEHFREALRLNSNLADALNNLAWILAANHQQKLRNPNEALALAKRACELTNYETPHFLDTLAAAYAAVGRFSEAVDTARKALEISKASRNDELFDDITKHLLLFEKEHAYIEPPPDAVSEHNRTPLKLEK